MLTKRAVTGLLATAMAAGAIIAGATAVTPTYYNTKAQTATQNVAAQGTLTAESAPSASPNTYYDI